MSAISVGPLHVGAVELLWLAINGIAVVLQLIAWQDARRDRADVALANGPIRRATAQGNVVRERLRTAGQLILLGLVAPALFDDREVRLSPFVLALIALSLVLLGLALVDWRLRRQLAGITREQIDDERRRSQQRIENGMARLEQAAERNLTATRHAAEESEKAAEAANSMNEKWLAGQVRADASEARAEERDAATDEYNVGADVIRRDTSKKATQIRDRIVRGDE